MKYLLFVLSLLILPIAAFAQETGFVPLTQVPGLTDMGNSFNLSSFLNTLYRLAIGVAAVVAVLQIMRAGIMYMGGDSVTEKKEAKNLIGLSIAGLILVLSPVIVFSIINPEILSLKIGNIEKLKPSADPYNTTTINTETEAACRERGGSVESAGPPVVCRVPRTTEDGTGQDQRCQDYTIPNFSPVAMPGTSCSFNATGGLEGYVAIADSCCSGMTEGGVCCGKMKETEGGTGTDRPEVQPPTAAAYGWRMILQPRSGGSGTLYYKSGFTTSAQCSTHLDGFMKERDLIAPDVNQPSLCVCGSPLSSQTNCSGF